jgi:cell division protease FtsH
VLTQAERWIIAIHEASHAVVTRSIGQTVAAQKLSIVARGRQLGTAAHMLTDRDRAIAQEPDLQRQLVSVVAGAAGERIEYGFLSTGVHDDLHAATNLARRMVTSFGMSKALGPVTIGEREGEVFLGASLQDLGSVGQATLDLIDREVERFVGEALEKAAVILERNWPSVEETAQALIEHETLSGVALEAVLSTVQSMALDGISVTRRPNGTPNPRPARER